MLQGSKSIFRITLNSATSNCAFPYKYHLTKRWHGHQDLSPKIKLGSLYSGMQYSSEFPSIPIFRFKCFSME